MVEVKGNKVKFDCPRCKTRLSSRIKEAGGIDSCPTCGAQFRTPGMQARKDWEAQKQHDAALREIKRDSKAEKRQRKAEIRREKAASRQRVNNHAAQFKAAPNRLDGTYFWAKVWLRLLMIAAFCGGAGGWLWVIIYNATQGRWIEASIFSFIAVISGFISMLIPFIVYAVSVSIFQIEANTRRTR